MTVTNRRRITAVNRLSTFPEPAEPSPDFPPESFYAVRHLPFPNVPFSRDFVNELILFAYSFCSMVLQFFHLYRTFPSQNPVNFYLIDKFLASFIVVMSARRLVYGILDKTTEYLCPKKYLNIARVAFKITWLILFTGLLLACCFKIFQNYSFLYIICLSYPLILYLFIFRLRIDPFLKLNAPEADVAIMNGFPVHSCSMNANSIRSEIEMLKNDFNNRFKQVIFTSITSAYYASFIPLVFVYKHLYYDTLWSVQHLAFVFLGYFAMLFAFVFPVKYSDVLHRASLHLGVWNKISTRNHPPPLPWNKSIIWPFGTYVKFAGDVFRSNSISTCATPSNSSHYRFYIIFKNPSNIYSVVSIVVSVIVVIQLLLLFTVSNEWQNILSLSILILFNFYTLFRVLRDYMISKHIYSAETSVNEKIRNNTAPINTATG